MLKRNLNRQKGSSLVELIVVMTIIAIIMSIAIVGYTVFIKNAKRVKSDQELTQVYNLIYMDANQFGIEIGLNSNNDTALYVSTSGNKIVLVYNDAPNKNLAVDWDWDDLNNWIDETNWNDLLLSLIDDVTGDINMFAGRFELDPKEETAVINSIDGGVDIVSKRHITYILENDEELRSKKELIITTLRDVHTVTRFLNDLEASTNGTLVPEGRKRPTNANDVEQIDFEIWFVWTAAAGFVMADEFIGTLAVDFQVKLVNDELTLAELQEANDIINDKNDPLFEIIVVHDRGGEVVSDYPDVINVTIRFKREPHDKAEYNLIQGSKIELVFTINIDDVVIYKKIDGTP